MDLLNHELLNRQAVKEYDTEYKLSETELLEMIEFATHAPSAWNLQHWKFLVVQSDEKKQQLMNLAWHQKQISDSSATFIILGDKEAGKNLDLAFSVEKGEITEEIKAAIKKQVDGAYQHKDYAYEAAVLNASLPAMQLMNAATLKGLGSCAIGGFQRTELIEQFNIDDRYVPILLITIGKSIKKPRQTSRIPAKDVTTFL